MESMKIYDQLRNTPREARKEIQAGRLKGFTDINPMWRIKRLTEVFGPCGIGWYYVPKNVQFVPGAGAEIACFVDIDLFYKDGENWSKPVPGNGGSMLVAAERNGPRTSDEAIKMATTDAIGSACKMLGMSSDIYYEKDRTKYTAAEEPQSAPPVHVCARCGRNIEPVRFKSGKVIDVASIVVNSQKEYGKELCYECCKAEAEARK